MHHVGFYSSMPRKGMRVYADVAGALDALDSLDVTRYRPQGGGMGLAFRGRLSSPDSWGFFYDAVVEELPLHESVELDLRDVESVSPNGGIIAVACIMAARRYGTDVSFMPSEAINRALEVCRIGRLLARYMKEPGEQPSLEPAMAAVP